MTCNNVLAHITPSSHSSLALVAGDGHGPFAGLLGIYIQLDIEHDDCTLETHTLFRNSQQLRTILIKFNPLYSSIKVPDLQTFPSMDIP